MATMVKRALKIDTEDPVPAAFKESKEVRLPVTAEDTCYGLKNGDMISMVVVIDAVKAKQVARIVKEHTRKL